jgi:hypothetical protein
VVQQPFLTQPDPFAAGDLCISHKACYNLHADSSNRPRYDMVSETITLDQALSISRQLSLADRLALISLLSEQARRELERDTEQVDMLSLSGLGAELWQQVDVKTYLDQERASWES